MARKPMKLKVLEGNRAKVAQAALKPDIDGIGRPRPPDGLNPSELALWWATVNSLPVGLLTRADDAILEQFAVLWSRSRRIAAEIAVMGDMIAGRGASVANPLLMQHITCIREIRALANDIGLSPVARARITAAGAEAKDPMELVMGGEEDGAWSTGKRQA